MHVDEGAEFGRRVRRQFAPDCLQFLVHPVDGILQPLDLGFHLVLADQVMLDLERGRRQQVRASYRDAARYRYAM